MQQEIKSFLRL